MYGHVERENRGSMAPGQDLVTAGYIGRKGTAAAARCLDRQLRQRFPEELVKRVQEMDQDLFPKDMDISKDLEFFEQFGATECEHVSEGGMMAALWNLTGAYGLGMEIELRSIPILQETVEVCELADLNPYRLWSEGCYLLAADSGWSLVRNLEKAGIPAVIIGTVTKDQKRLICNGEVRTFLDRPQADEIHKIEEGSWR